MKRIHFFIFCLFCATIIIFISCREDSDTVSSYAYNQNDKSNFDDASSSFEGQFKAIWTALNCNYPLWDYEEKFGLDWDNVYDKYLPIFQSFDKRLHEKHDTVAIEEIHNVYKEILSPLHDGHFYAIIKHIYRKEVQDTIFPSLIRNKSKIENSVIIKNLSYYIDSIDNSQIEEHIEAKLISLSTGYEYASFNDGIVYLRLPNINLSNVMNYTFMSDEDLAKLDSIQEGYSLLVKLIENTYKEQQEVWTNWFNKIQKLHQKGQLRGIIIDLRNNPGGYGADFKYLLGALIKPDNTSNKKNIIGCQFGQIRAKASYGRLDFLPLEPYFHPIYPLDHEVIDKEPVVILANELTGSAAEHICLYAKQMSNGMVIGTQTYGALSPLIEPDNEGKIYSIFYSGIVGHKKEAPFYLYIPFAAFITDEGDILESIGIKPDIEVRLDNNLYQTTGRDTQLERALEYIHTGK